MQWNPGGMGNPEDWHPGSNPEALWGMPSKTSPLNTMNPEVAQTQDPGALDRMGNNMQSQFWQPNQVMSETPDQKAALDRRDPRLRRRRQQGQALAGAPKIQLPPEEV